MSTFDEAGVPPPPALSGQGGGSSPSRRLLAGAVLLLSCTCAQAHEAGTQFAEWFNTRMRPDAPEMSCCGVADQFYARSYRPSAEPDMAFEVEVEPKGDYPSWTVQVPAAKVDWKSVNPTGRGVIYIGITEWDYGAPICFVPGSGV